MAYLWALWPFFCALWHIPSDGNGMGLKCHFIAVGKKGSDMVNRDEKWQKLGGGRTGGGTKWRDKMKKVEGQNSGLGIQVWRGGKGQKTELEWGNVHFESKENAVFLMGCGHGNPDK